MRAFCVVIFCLLPICCSATVTACFSPKGGCAQQIVTEVTKAKTLIWVQMYIFSNMDIAKALSIAKGRGVDVKIILDSGEGLTYATEKWLIASSGIPIWIDAKHPIAHAKVMIIDTSEVITGSYNYTVSADLYNSEDNLILKGYTALTPEFKANFSAHLAHSVSAPVPQTQTQSQPFARGASR
jgi:phosphatidylserine/phosphatidylglycerophosphate/cardiolipin synthase-like enzyme